MKSGGHSDSFGGAWPANAPPLGAGTFYVFLFVQTKRKIKNSASFFVFTFRDRKLRSPLKDIVVGKNQSEWKKFRVGGKNIFQMFCVLSQNFCVPSRNFAFPRKTFAFSRKDICVPSQNFCFLS